MLVGNLFCLTKFSGYFAMNNAKGCYNRIDHIFTILVLPFLVCPGLSLQIYFVFFKKHAIVFKQAIVCFEPVYSNKDENKPIDGVSQGNRLGSSLWCLISTIIIKTYKQKDHGTIITTPISKKEVSLLGVAYTSPNAPGWRHPCLSRILHSNE